MPKVTVQNHYTDEITAFEGTEQEVKFGLIDRFGWLNTKDLAKMMERLNNSQAYSAYIEL